MSRLRRLKIRRYFRFWWKFTLQETAAPLFDKREFFGLLSVPIFLLLVFIVSGRGTMETEISEIGLVGLALLLTIPIWFVLSMLRSLFLVPKNERNKGRWFENRFVYNSPQLVYTTLLQNSREGAVLDIFIEDAEPNTIAQLKIECDPDVDSVVGAYSHPKPHVIKLLKKKDGYYAHIYSELDNKFNVDKDRMVYISVSFVDPLPPTIIRIYLLYWEVGLDNGAR